MRKKGRKWKGSSGPLQPSEHGWLHMWPNSTPS